MAEMRIAAGEQRAQSPLESVEYVKQMLFSGQGVGEGENPTIHLTYTQVTVDGVPTLRLDIPLNQSAGDMRVKPKRWDDRANKWLNPTAGITVSATYSETERQPEPPVMYFRQAGNGEIVGLRVRKGFTINIGLNAKSPVSAPVFTPAKPAIPAGE